MAEVMAENYHNIWAKKKKMELESKGKPESYEPHTHTKKKPRRGKWGRRNGLREDSVRQSKWNRSFLYLKQNKSYSRKTYSSFNLIKVEVVILCWYLTTLWQPRRSHGTVKRRKSCLNSFKSMVSSYLGKFHIFSYICLHSGHKPRWVSSPQCSLLVSNYHLAGLLWIRVLVIFMFRKTLWNSVGR